LQAGSSNPATPSVCHVREVSLTESAKATCTDSACMRRSRLTHLYLSLLDNTDLEVLQSQLFRLGPTLQTLALFRADHRRDIGESHTICSRMSKASTLLPKPHSLVH
jgi:hypothetical protein